MPLSEGVRGGDGSLRAPRTPAPHPDLGEGLIGGVFRACLAALSDPQALVVRDGYGGATGETKCPQTSTRFPGPVTLTLGICTFVLAS